MNSNGSDSNFNMNNLTLRFLDSVRNWIERLIPEKTRECLRTKIAIIKDVNSDGTFNVILAGDYGTYLDLIEQKNVCDEYNNLKQRESSLSEAERKRLNELKKIIDTLYNGEILTQDSYNKKVSMLVIENLVPIKSDTYSVSDYVVIGYVDNKLTNSFIIYKNVKKGV